jgi:hypothetical protein
MKRDHLPRQAQDKREPKRDKRTLACDSQPPRRWGAIRNCPVFATCPTFTLRGKRLPKVEDRFGRSSGGGWLPMMMRRVGSDVAPCGSGEERDRGWLEIDGANNAPFLSHWYMMKTMVYTFTWYTKIGLGQTK